jgi:hypothetical protein
LLKVYDASVDPGSKVEKLSPLYTPVLPHAAKFEIGLVTNNANAVKTAATARAGPSAGTGGSLWRTVLGDRHHLVTRGQLLAGDTRFLTLTPSTTTATSPIRF